MTSARQPNLRERTALFSQLIQEPGWQLLQQTFRPEIRSRITDTDARESFLYEAIRAQFIQEIFSAPHLVIQQAKRAWHKQSQTNEPNPLSQTPSTISDPLEDDAYPQSED
jgi:hypothetical protein